MQIESLLTARTAARDARFIYIACPWSPVGGGMFKVADYLIQSQGQRPDQSAATLRPLNSRGGGSAAWSLFYLLRASALLVRGRMNGQLAGVHVNMAERLSVIRKGLIVVACRVLGIPVVLHLHAAQLHRTFPNLPGVARTVLRWVFSLPKSVVVLGKVSADFVTRELKVPAERVQIVINGVPKPTATRRAAVAGAVQRVLFVGNLSERKGVSDLLHALAQPEFFGRAVQVIFAGGGEVAAYRALADRLGLSEWVRFDGWTGQEALAHLLAGADVLVLPSHDEGLPLAILEALAHGVAVVCTPVGEIPGVLTDGVDACFVQPGDIDSIATGLLRVLDDSELRKTLERNGQALYESQFSLMQFCTSIAKIHQRHFGICSPHPLQDNSPVLKRVE